jgi:hypothetical protein
MFSNEAIVGRLLSMLLLVQSHREQYPPKLRNDASRRGRRQDTEQMKYQYTYEDFMHSLKWLEAEGYIEQFIDEDGNVCVRICEGAENCEL